MKQASSSKCGGKNGVYSADEFDKEQQSEGWKPKATGKKKKRRERGRERVGLVLRGFGGLLVENDGCSWALKQPLSLPIRLIWKDGEAFDI
ncbi:hypothetical protein EYF80_011608 [Liparis tanakae]|uniref:Uncharacterized protein n=1 Tax=Liparis tanakae TaxID=230148 RepID=A0A4Z2ILR2_9TELE|nr:hypothetical protein EYF80_011608 [Liparis tanakae]